jgi:hypothetical protein
MMLATGIFRDCLRPAAFPGGGAPLRFRAELRHSARCYQAFANAGSWIEEFFDLVPGLDQGPLCGPLLEELANALLQTANGQAAPRAANARHTVTELSGSSPRRSRQDLRTITQRVASPEFPESWKPHAAGSAFTSAIAERLAVTKAKQASSLAFRTRAAASSIDPASLHDRAVPEVDSASQRAAPPVSVSTTRDWQDRINERVAARLTGSTFGPASSSTSSSYLAHQWMVPLDGPAASEELLTFASAASARFEGPERSAAPANNSFSPLGPAHDRDGQPTPDLPMAAARMAQSAPVLAPSEGTSAAPAWTESRSSYAVQEFTQELIARANDAPWVPHAHATSSISHATEPTAPARLSRSEVEPANQSILESGENLTALSSMMKRILDEEARRYGIEV